MSDSFKAIADKNNKLYGKTKKYADIAYFVAVLFIVAGRAMVLTREANAVFVTTIVYTGSALLFLIGAYRLFFQIFKNWKKALLGFLVVVFSFVYSEFSSSASEFPVVALAIVGAMDVSADSILLSGIIGNLVMIANNILVTLFGNNYSEMYALGNNDYLFLGDNSFSFPVFNNYSSTDFAAHYFWILAAYIWIRGKKITWGEVLAFGALDALIYSMTGSNTTLFGISLLFILVVFLKISTKVSETAVYKNGLLNSVISGINKFFSFCFKYSYIALALVAVVLAVLYSTGDPVFYRLNSILHARLSLGHRGINEYGINLFSTEVHVFGSKSSIDNFYNFIDCSYLSLLIKGGLAPLLFYLASMTTIQLKHKKFIFGTCLLAICALSCFEEHHLAQLPYNFFILLLFADLNIDNKLSDDQCVKTRWKSMINCIAWILCGAFAVSAGCIYYSRFDALKRINRLDNKANSIYYSVQDNLDDLVGNGTWKQKITPMNSSLYGETLVEPNDFEYVTGTSWSEMNKDPKVHSYYTVYYDNQVQFTDDSILSLLITDDVKSLIGDGSIIIEYDVQSGSLYSIWYSESYGCNPIEGEGFQTPNRRAKMSTNTINVGYSTGDKNE